MYHKNIINGHYYNCCLIYIIICEPSVRYQLHQHFAEAQECQQIGQDTRNINFSFIKQIDTYNVLPRYLIICDIA